jgi:endogenous inhibitor of DNA gyrase (YacG/DUF329 family)
MKRLCPICKTPTDSATSKEFPFCSERCRLLDLGNWASEKYAVSEPVFDLSEAEGESGAPKSTDDEDFKGFRKPDGTIH